jgi:hypothetical protein
MKQITGQAVVEFANSVRKFVQGLIGLVILAIVVLKFSSIIWQFIGWGLLFSSLKGVRILELVGAALGFSAAMDLAYMLYTEGPDEAVQPVIVGLAATILMFVSATKPEDLGWQTALTVLLLAVTIALLFYVRDTHIEKKLTPPEGVANRDQNDWGAS